MQNSLSPESLSLIKLLIESKLNEYRFVPCVNNDQCTKKYQLALEELESLKPVFGTNVRIQGRIYWMCRCSEKAGKVREFKQNYCDKCNTYNPDPE